VSLKLCSEIAELFHFIKASKEQISLDSHGLTDYVVRGSIVHSVDVGQ